MQGLFTVSRNDFYDFLNCPKIVALKIHRNFTQPPKPRVTYGRGIQYEIGTIGEVVTKEVFSERGDELVEEFEDTTEYDIDEEIEEPTLPRALEVNLTQKGVSLDQEMRKILQDTIEGLKNIKKYLSDEYGEIRILGKAESKNGVLPGKIRPDFVAISSDKKKPILIEVKNTAKMNPKSDTFQASFYNSITQQHGVMILQERIENETISIIPKLLQNVLPETVIVYPRRGEYQKISDTIKINQKIIDDIWQAKILGVLGKTPHTDCGVTCLHHRYGSLPEDNIEPAIPLPLVYAEGLRTQNHNLDIDYLHRFLYKTGIGQELTGTMFDFRYSEWQLDLIKQRNPKQFEKKKKFLNEKRDQYLDIFSEKTGLKRNVVDELSEFRYSVWRNDKKILKEMRNEIHPWEKALGKDKFKKMHPYAKGFTTQIYSLPEKSDSFIKKSWREWT